MRSCFSTRNVSTIYRIKMAADVINNSSPYVGLEKNQTKYSLNFSNINLDEYITDTDNRNNKQIGTTNRPP